MVIYRSLLVGEGAHTWAENNGIEIVDEDDLISDTSRRSYIKNKRKLEYHDALISQEENGVGKMAKLESDQNFHVNNYNSQEASDIGLEVEITSDGSSSSEKKLDTIGVVCVDGGGRVASTVSSGGILLKQPGRVGQAALYGCGCWAENDGGTGVATTTSGCGEHLVKTMLARECAENLKNLDEPVQSLISCFQNKFIGM